MEKPILLVAFDTLGRFFSIIIIFLKTHFLRKIEDAIIGHYIPARDIVLPSNYRFGKRRQKNLPDSPRYLKLFSNARIKLKIPDEGFVKLFSYSLRTLLCHNQSSRSCFKFMTVESTNGTASKKNHHVANSEIRHVVDKEKKINLKPYFT